MTFTGGIIRRRSRRPSTSQHPTSTIAKRRAVLMTSLLDGASIQPGRDDPAIAESLVDEPTRLTLTIARSA